MERRRPHILSVSILILSALSLYSQEVDSLGIAQRDTLIRKTLGEVVVKAPRILRTTTKDVYRVTDDIIGTYMSPLDILNSIPGIYFTPFDNKIRINNEERIVLTVDNVERSQEYIGNLAKDRIDKVEIIKVPQARFITKGYRMQINYVLKRNWEGNTLTLQGFTMAVPPQNNGGDIPANVQPKVNYEYISPRVSFDGGGGGGIINWNYTKDEERAYKIPDGLSLLKSESTSPNDLNAHKGFSLNTSTTFRVNPENLWFLSGKLKSENRSHSNAFTLSRGEKKETEYLDLSDKDRDLDFNTILSNQSQFGNKLDLFTTLGYNYFRRHSDFSYALRDNDPVSSEKSHQLFNRHFVVGQIDATYNWSETLSSTLGYQSSYSHLVTTTDGNKGSSPHLNEVVNKVYTQVSWYPGEALYCQIGAALESMHRNSEKLGDKLLYVLPQASIGYQPNELWTLNLDYSTEVEYPRIHQQSLDLTQENPYMVLKGNPILHPNVSHLISFQTNFSGNLTLGGAYLASNNDITEFYSKTKTDVYQSYINAGMRQYTAYADYSWQISDHWSWSNFVRYDRTILAGEGLKSSIDNTTLRSQLYYIDPSRHFRGSVEFFREMVRTPLLQGYQDRNQDYFQISLQKNLMNDRLSIALHYIPPISPITRRYQEKRIETDYYRMFQNLNLGTYDNLLMLRVKFQLGGSSKSKKRYKTPENRGEHLFKDEHKEDRGLL